MNLIKPRNHRPYINSKNDVHLILPQLKLPSSTQNKNSQIQPLGTLSYENDKIITHDINPPLTDSQTDTAINYVDHRSNLTTNIRDSLKKMDNMSVSFSFSGNPSKKTVEKSLNNQQSIVQNGYGKKFLIEMNDKQKLKQSSVDNSTREPNPPRKRIYLPNLDSKKSKRTLNRGYHMRINLGNMLNFNNSSSIQYQSISFDNSNNHNNINLESKRSGSANHQYDYKINDIRNRSNENKNSPRIIKNKAKYLAGEGFKAKYTNAVVNKLKKDLNIKHIKVDYNQKACMIQRIWRGYKTRKEYKIMKLKLLNEKVNIGNRLIRLIWKFNNKLSSRNDLYIQKVKIIQNYARVYLARKELRKRKRRKLILLLEIKFLKNLKKFAIKLAFDAIKQSQIKSDKVILGNTNATKYSSNNNYANNTVYANNNDTNQRIMPETSNLLNSEKTYLNKGNKRLKTNKVAKNPKNSEFDEDNQKSHSSIIDNHTKQKYKSNNQQKQSPSKEKIQKA